MRIKKMLRRRAVVASLAGMLAAFYLSQVIFEGEVQASGLLPNVVVTEPSKLDSLDWSRLRDISETAYPNRWDDLTLIDGCLWIPATELAARLGLSVRLESTTQDFQCKYRAYLPNGASGVVLSVYIELHGSAEYPRNSERNFTTGAGSMQFKPFDVGAEDLNVYVNDRSQYLYVFPEGGRTMWRLQYKPTYGMGDVYRSGAGTVVRSEDIGTAFMQLLVEKYDARLQAVMGANPADVEASPAAAGAAAPPASPVVPSKPSPSSVELATGDLNQAAQNYLKALGYEPGNTDGQVDTMTMVAISQFQAEKGLDVTGEITPQLVGILAAEVDKARPR